MQQSGGLGQWRAGADGGRKFLPAGRAAALHRGAMRRNHRHRQRRCDVHSREGEFNYFLSIHLSRSPSIAQVYNASKLMEYCQGFLLQNMVALLTYDDSVKRLLFAKKIPNHDVLSGLLTTLQQRIKTRRNQPTSVSQNVVKSAQMNGKASHNNSTAGNNINSSSNGLNRSSNNLTE